MHRRLVDRTPVLDAEALLARFAPPPRFGAVRFDTFRPDSSAPSQATALAACRGFAAEVAAAGSSGRVGWRVGRRRAPTPSGRPARYLDGGFGVGKTHLLAALWHEVSGALPSAYLSFTELTATVGFLGMDEAVAAFSSRFRLLCIDEFELDDVANTLLCVSFLRALIGDGARVATTSNSLPDRLGEGRFNADDFHREIAAIAAHFEVVRMDGPDYRRRHGGATPPPLADDALEALAARAGPGATADHFDELVAHLRRVHPVHYPALLDGVDTVLLRDLRPLENQGDALLVVQLVDELYDAEVAVAASGCRVDELFSVSYRSGGYRKKYGRCESRLASLLQESATA